MSAPNTNLEKQGRQHRGPLRGMFAVVLFALVLLAFLAFWAFGRGGTPEGAESQVEVTTGEIEEIDEGVVSANVDANDDAQAVDPEADPTAATVPSVTVTHPQSGQSDEINPLTGGSDSAVPPNPVEETDVEVE